ncbi:MAG: FtsX-like permease family protein [Armatimonadota bacterium]
MGPWRLLARMAVRDIRASAGPWAAIGAVIALGVAFHGVAWQAYRNLDRTYSASYRALRFEDFRIRVPGAPRRVVTEFRALPGVAAVVGRIEEDVAIRLGRRGSAPLVGRLIGIEPGAQGVNALSLREGRFPERPMERAVLVEASFARHHGLHPGGTVVVERSGTRTDLRIAGIVASPEYVYVVRSRQDILPSPDAFGVLFVPEGTLGRLVGRAGRIDAIHVRMGDAGLREAAIGAMARRLAPWRPEVPERREDQPSHQLLQQDVDGFRGYSVLFPALFLAVAGLTLDTLLTRQVAAGRARIGLLQALGFGRAGIVATVVCGPVLVGMAASLTGSVLGAWLARVFTGFYLEHVSVAVRVVDTEPATVAMGWSVGLGLSIGSSLRPARHAARIAPSEALRPPAPAAARHFLPDRWIPGLPWGARMALRNLARQPRRTVSTLAGVVAGLVLIIVAQGLSDTVDSLMGTLTSTVFREDLRVDFGRAASGGTLERVRRWPGVEWAEGESGWSVEFRHAGIVREGMALGIAPGARFRRAVDASGRAIAPGEGSALFGAALRARLRLAEGDLVEFRVSPSEEDREPPWRTVRVAGFPEDPVGTVATFRREDLRRAVGRRAGMTAGSVGTIRLLVAPEWRGEVRRRLADLDGAVSVTASADLRAKIDSMMQLMRRFTGAMRWFGLALAFAVVFNTVTVNVLEREMEAATLRTIGMGRLALAGMLLAENVALAACGCLAGMPLGVSAAKAFLLAAQTPEQMELFAMVPVVRPETPWSASLSLMLAVAAAAVPSLVHLGRLDLAAAVKRVAR